MKIITRLLVCFGISFIYFFHICTNINFVYANNWEKLNIDPVSIIPHTLYVHPNNNNLLLIGSNIAGQGIYKTTDGGNTWILLKNGLPVKSLVSSIDVSYQNNNKIYLALHGIGLTGVGGIYVSENGGISWNEKYRGKSLSDVVVDPKNDNIVYFLNTATGSEGGIYKSFNSGDSWIRITNDLDYYPVHLKKLNINNQDSNILYLSAVIFRERYGIYKTLNGGENWISLSKGLIDLGYFNGTFWDIEANPDDSNIIFAGSYIGAIDASHSAMEGLFSSNDGGNNWSYLESSMGKTGIFDILIHPTKTNLMFISARDSNHILSKESGIYFSINSGETWTQINEGFPNFDQNTYPYELFLSLADRNLLFTSSSNGIWKLDISDLLVPPCLLTRFPEPMTQTDLSWGDIPYGGTYKYIERTDQQGSPVKELVPFKWYDINQVNSGKDSIAAWGCTMTSHAMIVNYYAKLQDVRDPHDSEKIFQTDPELLNDWLQRNNGFVTNPVLYDNNGQPYTDKSWVDADAVVRYARENGVKLSYQETLAYSNGKQSLLDAQCSLRPAILKVSNAANPFHFVVATGNIKINDTETWRLHDPLESNVVDLLTTYGNTFSEVRIASTEVPREFLTFSMHSPAEFYVTDSLGRRHGYDPRSNTHFSEIPNANYSSDSLGSALGDAVMSRKVLTIYDPTDGDYHITIVGIGEGDYAFSTRYSQVGQNSIGEAPFISGNTKVGKIEQALVKYSQSEGGVTAVEKLPYEVRVENRSSRKNGKEQFSQGYVPLTVFGDTYFSVDTIDSSSVKAGFNQSPHENKDAYDDVDEDGFIDMTYYFKVKNISLSEEEYEVCLTGLTLDETLFKGCTSIETRKTIK